MRTLLSILLISVLGAPICAQHRVIIDPKVEVATSGSSYRDNVLHLTYNVLSKIGFIRVMLPDADGAEEADFRVTAKILDLVNLPKISDDDKTRYRYKLPFQLSIVRLSDNTVIATQSFRKDGFSDDSMQDAVLMSIGDNAKNVEIFFHEKIPYVGEVLEVTEADKKTAKQLYISLGSRIGIEKGQKLDVKQRAMNATGKSYLKTLGKVQVSEVEGEEGARCKVTDGGEKILLAFNESPDDLVVITTKPNKNIWEHVTGK